MIKFLFKSIIVVLLLLMLIPMFKLLWRLVGGVLVNAGIFTGETVDPWGIAAICFTGLFIFFMVLIFKD